MHQSGFVAKQENMNFVITLLILVIFWQFCDANEITKKLKKQVKELKTKYASIKLGMGMYIEFLGTYTKLILLNGNVYVPFGYFAPPFSI